MPICSRSRYIQLLLMPLLLVSPWHQQLWYWLQCSRKVYSDRQTICLMISSKSSDILINHQRFQFKYSRKVFQMIRQFVWWFWTNHQTFCKIISNVWWANGFSWTLWLCRIYRSWFHRRKNFYNMCRLGINWWHKMQIYFEDSSMNFSNLSHHSWQLSYISRWPASY